LVDIYPKESIQSIIQAVQTVFSQSTILYNANNPAWYFIFSYCAGGSLMKQRFWF
jgi:hypothetical protein